MVRSPTACLRCLFEIRTSDNVFFRIWPFDHWFMTKFNWPFVNLLVIFPIRNQRSTFSPAINKDIVVQVLGGLLGADMTHVAEPFSQTPHDPIHVSAENIRRDASIGRTFWFFSFKVQKVSACISFGFPKGHCSSSGSHYRAHFRKNFTIIQLFNVECKGWFF